MCCLFTFTEGAAPIILKAPRRFVAAAVFNPLERTLLARMVAVFVGKRISDLYVQIIWFRWGRFRFGHFLSTQVGYEPLRVSS